MQKNTEWRKPKSNLASLQVLRAIAAISVVYLHTIYPQPTNIFPVFGKFGVDIFFVLSGFVMALVIGRGQAARDFAISRVARVVPLYWLISTFLFFVVLVKPEYLATSTANITNFILSLLFIPHIRDSGTMHPLLAVGWTLNYEMFFYLCIWCSILLKRNFYLTLVTSIFVLLSLAGTYADDLVLKTFFGSLYLLEFILGLLAFHLYKHQFFNQINKGCLLVLIVLCYSFMAYAEAHDFTNNRVLIYGFPSMLLMLFMLSLEQSITVKENIFSSVFTKIGDASYAIYLSHLYIVEGIRRVVLKNTQWEYYYTYYGVALTVILALIFGHLIYIYLDKPMSKYVRKYLSSKF